jgi:8-oxo-dGTP diphosphatase
MPMPLRVAAAAILSRDGAVLVSRRPEHAHQGGLWEFPGGKLEPGEDGREALERELHEELGIAVRSATPLIRVSHDYPDRSVVLEVWKVQGYTGMPRGREGQPLRWVHPDELDRACFPAANIPIINALRLPECYLITPEPGADDDMFLARLDRALTSGVRLVQLRAHSLAESAYLELARRATALAHRRRASLLLNRCARHVESIGADGVHLSGRELLATPARPLASDRWVAASCHDERELRHARWIGVDFAVLSPVLATPSHPEARPLGWLEFQRLVRGASVPLYALGGMSRQHLETVRARGGQGIAAIRGLWDASA